MLNIVRKNKAILFRTHTQKHVDKDAMDYFRAVIRTDEKSERVLLLTQDIIDMNPAHYTVW